MSFYVFVPTSIFLFQHRAAHSQSEDKFYYRPPYDETTNTNQGTIGSGRVGDACAFNTDCLSGMYCSQGSCNCLGTYVSVDSYCFLKINPSESGCNYDAQCSSVWPSAYCRNGICNCPSPEMIAVKTKDGVVCVWSSASEPSCPLPSLPPPGSLSALLPLPGPTHNGSSPFAACSPDGPPVHANEDLEEQPERFACAVFNIDGAAHDVSDIYDCIDNSEFWANHGRPSEAPVGVCCMSRALTCIQPRRGESASSETVARWWYNSVAGGCEAFLFDASLSDVSSNNFATQAHCESYCQDTCSRGSPAMQPGISPQSDCSAATPCPSNFDCVHVSTYTSCCPTAKWICGNEGGRIGVPLASIFDSGLRYEHLALAKPKYTVPHPTTRFFFNPNEGRCDSFEYNGYVGNFNNFLTLTDCQNYCAKLLCSFGLPLDGGAGRPQKCGSDASCPSSHLCTDDGVCCPTAQTVCAQPMRRGECKQSIRSFWYDAHSLTCQSFIFTGCQGNENRFSSMEDCHRVCDGIRSEPRCPQGKALTDLASGKYLPCALNGESQNCPPNYECYFDGKTHGCCATKMMTCSLRPDKGAPCRIGSSYRFFYNREIKECETFLYLGCDGNSNNFITADECEHYCEASPVCPNGGKASRQSGRAISCISDSCPRGYECVLVDMTHSRCCPTRESICSDPPLVGNPKKCARIESGMLRFYFNPSKHSCVEYPTGACESANVFFTEEECVFFCLAAGCPAGDILFREDGTTKPLTCDPNRPCPLNAECLSNPLTNTDFCCGSDNMGVCPTGEKAFVDARSRSARQCDLSADKTCPAGAKCRFSQVDGRYYCCLTITRVMLPFDVCPPGRALFRYPDGGSLQCPLAPPGSCPPGFICLSHMEDSRHGQCCSDQPICPDGERFHPDPKTGLPTLCTKDAFSICPAGFHCRANGNRLFCCEATEKATKYEGCPPDQLAYLVNSKAQVCDPFSTPCVIGYTCQWSLSNKRYQCCGHGTPGTKKPTVDDSSGCAKKHFALIENGKVRICSPTLPCPLGFSCQFSTKLKRYQCCAQSLGCPNGHGAFVTLSGSSQVCDKSSTCPTGFQCVVSTKPGAGNICCSPDYAAPPAKPGARCVLDCTGGAKCVDGTCVCSPGYTVILDQCVMKCNENEVRVGSECLPKVKPGRSCKVTQQCTLNSLCEKERCKCAPKHVLTQEKCVPVVEICGEKARVLLFRSQPRPCSPETRPCPNGYNCIMAAVMGKNVCCGRLPGSTEVCPVGMSAHRRQGRPTPCSSGSCPDGFLCKFSSTKRKYFCCGRTKPGGCGEKALLNRQGLIVDCGEGRKKCPKGYTCTSYSSGYQCCPDEEEEEEEGEEEDEKLEEIIPGEEEEDYDEDTFLHPVICPPYLSQISVRVDGKHKLICVRCSPDDSNCASIKRRIENGSLVKALRISRLMTEPSLGTVSESKSLQMYGPP